MAQEECFMCEFFSKKCLLGLLALIVILLAGLVLVNAIIQSSKKEQNAMIQSAIAEGAPSVSIDGYCINGNVYIKNTKGEFVNFSRNINPLKCDAEGKITE